MTIFRISPIACFLAVAVVSAAGCSPVAERETPAPPGPPRVVLGEPAKRIEVGVVPRGGRREVAFVVANMGPAAVMVGTIRTGCDCLRVELNSTRVEAGTEVGGRAVIDFAHEPGFVGGLLLDASDTYDGRPVFALKLTVEVK